MKITDKTCNCGMTMRYIRRLHREEARLDWILEQVPHLWVAIDGVLHPQWIGSRKKIDAAIKSSKAGRRGKGNG